MASINKIFRYISCFIITFVFIFLPHPSLSETKNDNRLLNSINKSERIRKIRTKLNQNTVTLVVSAESDAQIQITRDLIDVMRQKGIRLLPILAEGGAQNALDIMFLRGVDIGIIQNDILAYLRGKNWFLYNDIFENVHYITKLYHAEWHLLGKKNFTGIKDLSGKIVNISKVNSGTYITSRNIFELLGVKAKYTYYSNRIALQKLRNGEIDAMAVIAGAPASMFQNIPKDSNLHFIPTNFIFDDILKTPLKVVLTHFYFPAFLNHEDYPNLIPEGTKVPTVANSIVFAVYNWDKSKNLNRKKIVSKFISIFFKEFKKFRESGRHQKWKEVNLAAKLVEWKRASTVSKILQRLGNNTRSDEFQTDKEFMEFNRFLRDIAKIDFSKLPKKEQRKMYEQYRRFKANQ